MKHDIPSFKQTVVEAYLHGKGSGTHRTLGIAAPLAGSLAHSPAATSRPNFI